MNNSAVAFRQAIADAGLTPPAIIVADGAIHRFATNGKRGDDSGWYILRVDGTPAGSFGDWRTGLKTDWASKQTREMSPKERADYAKRLASIKRQRDAEERRRQSDAAAKARRIWEAAKPASDEHAYLVRKQVKSLGLRLHRDGRLIVPMRDMDGALHSVEFIDDAGGKKFLAGGRKRGCCYMFGQIADLVHLCEGFATGASVHEATGLPVAVAFDAGGLMPAAQAIRAKYPKATIVLCGDHDASGIGQKAAREAAEAVGGLVAIPDTAGTDWNDVHVKSGLTAVKMGIEANLSAMRAPAPITLEAPAATPGTESADVALQIETAEDPSPITLETIDLPPLPTSCIPVAWLRDMIEAVTAATEVPAELPTVLALAVVATAAQRQWCVEISRSHVEQLSFWGARRFPAANVNRCFEGADSTAGGFRAAASGCALAGSKSGRCGTETIGRPDQTPSPQGGAGHGRRCRLAPPGAPTRRDFSP